MRSGLSGALEAVCVGLPRDVERNGRPASTAIWKEQVAGPVAVRGVNLDGDGQADRQAHGGPDKAVYAYGTDDRAWWQGELDRDLEPGVFGENLAVSGLDISGSAIGERWQVGSALLEVSEPRLPCWRLNLRMDDRRFIQKFNAAGRPGAYLRIIEEGALQQGDDVAVVASPEDPLSVGEVMAIYTSRSGVERVLNNPHLSESWRGWARSRLDRDAG